jgi:hypothetical protein
MAIKDKIVYNLIKYILIPRNEIIDKGGFIINKISAQKETTNLREVLLPESIFVLLEDEVVKKYKDAGKKVLYSAGKKFCYRYALISKHPTVKDGKSYLDFVYMFVRYLEAIYSSKMDYSINIEKKIFKLKMWDYIVCNKNGLGIVLTDGSSGMLSYAFSNPTIEGTQIKCKGRGDRYCELICTTSDNLKRMNLKFFSESNMNNLELEDSYNDVNGFRETEFSKTSFQDLINSGFFTQRTGIIKHNDERFLLLESSIMYIIEKELKKLKDADKLLFNVSFDCGRNLARKEGKDGFEKFIVDFLGASGFGDVMVIKEKGKYKILIRYFPWTKWADEIDFSMVRGMLSGMLSEASGKKVILKKLEKDLTQGYFSLVLTE